MTQLIAYLSFGASVLFANAAFLQPQAKIQTANFAHWGEFQRVPEVVQMLNTPPPTQTNSSIVASKTLAAPASVVVENKSLLLHAAGANGTNAWGSGVVHFLFLVNDRLPHSNIWREFFHDAPQGSWRVLVHCQDLAGCIRNGVFTDNPGFAQVATTPTWYCHDLVTAMAKLLSEALALNAAMMGGREKFVFLSESTLPIKPFGEIHTTLLADDASDFCLFPTDQWGSASIDGSFVKLLKHHQWVVLTRDHALLFVRDWIPVNQKSEWRVWLKSGTWQGHHRNVLPQNFYYPVSANTCTDEWAFMATIFGALEPMNGARYLPGFGGGHLDMDTHTGQGRCRTWSYWDNTWDPAATALGSQIANDFYGSKVSCYPKCFARPATLQKLSHSSLHALRKSPFLFARKFEPNMWMPHFYSIVLSS